MWNVFQLINSWAMAGACGGEPEWESSTTELTSTSTEWRVEQEQALSVARRKWLTCRRPYLVVNWLLLFANIGCLLYAGFRHIQMRRRFGLPGDDVRDYLTWLFLPWCALAQESRTLHANRVEGGVWHGALPVAQPGAWQQPPWPQQQQPGTWLDAPVQHPGWAQPQPGVPQPGAQPAWAVPASQPDFAQSVALQQEAVRAAAAPSAAAAPHPLQPAPRLKTRAEDVLLVAHQGGYEPPTPPHDAGGAL